MSLGLETHGRSSKWSQENNVAASVGVKVPGTPSAMAWASWNMHVSARLLVLTYRLGIPWTSSCTTSLDDTGRDMKMLVEFTRVYQVPSGTANFSRRYRESGTLGLSFRTLVEHSGR